MIIPIRIYLESAEVVTLKCFLRFTTFALHKMISFKRQILRLFWEEKIKVFKVIFFHRDAIVSVPFEVRYDILIKYFITYLLIFIPVGKYIFKFINKIQIMFSLLYSVKLQLTIKTKVWHNLASFWWLLK